MLRRFFKMSTNINTHTHYQSNNNNFSNNNKKNWIYIHILLRKQKLYSLFNHQIKIINNMVITKFNNITKGLYGSTGRKIDAHKTPNVTWAKAINSWIKESLCRLVNLIFLLYHILMDK